MVDNASWGIAIKLTKVRDGCMPKVRSVTMCTKEESAQHSSFDFLFLKIINSVLSEEGKEGD